MPGSRSLRRQEVSQEQAVLQGLKILLGLEILLRKRRKFRLIEKNERS